MDVLITNATITALLAGYLIGSIPFGLLLTKAAGLGDVRSIGSGNIGATNVLRTGNKLLAATTLLLDILKGTLATAVAYLIALWLAETPGQDSAHVSVAAFPWMVVCFGGLGAFLGHLFPVWLGFKGGKGVATYLGVLIGTLWPIALTFAIVWLLTAYLTRYSSVAALLASLFSVILAMSIAPPHVAALCAFMTVLLIMKHRANIKRLINGEEPKIGGAKKSN